jgi:hypothetical protein
MGILILTAALALSLLLSPSPEAWAADDADTELAKKTLNAVADLISVPFQNNFNLNTGTKDEMITRERTLTILFSRRAPR